MSKLHKAQTQQGHSRVFFDYIRSIGEAKSKQEEDKIVSKDLITLKQSMGEKGVAPKTMKELVIRMAYAEMLGHSAEFGHIHAVNLASTADTLFKRVGYLTTWLCVNPENQLMYLIVSNMQRDMKSANFLDVAGALTSASKLIQPELMSAINTDIVGLLQHPNALVRKKAVMCLHAFYTKSEGAIGDTKEYRNMLCDRDPAVMGAALNLMHDVLLRDPEAHRDLLPSFLSILKQVTEHRLSRDYDYHRVPAPWLQVQLLKLCAILAAEDEDLSNKCAEVLVETMKRADVGLNIGHAVIFEVIMTITSIFPINELIESAADATSKFLTSSNANMKYLGIAALSRIVKINPKFAAEHQGIVIDCLEDSDETIRRRTISLLFAMCNENNCEVIIARVLKVLRETTDNFLRQDLVRNVCDIADRFNPSNEWYVETLNKVLEYAAEHVTQTTIQGLLKIIAEGDGEDEAEDAAFRTQCVEDYFALTENQDKVLPPVFYQVAAWVIGEYGFLTKKISRAMMLDRLCDILERQTDAATRAWVVSAMMKLVAHNQFVPDNVEDVVNKLKDSRSVVLQQRCYEFLELMTMIPIMRKALPLDGCCEDVDVDESLSFLDGIVADALAAGARPYEKKEVGLGGGDASEFKTGPYKAQQANVVDEDDLDADKWKTEETEELVIKGGDRKWGAKNLEEEAGVEHKMQAADDAGEGDNAGEGGEGGAGGGATQQHVDPMAGEPQQSKNAKFMADIFSGMSAGSGGKRRKKGGGAARAKEAARRAEEAQEATQHMKGRAASAEADEGEADHGEQAQAQAQAGPSGAASAPAQAQASSSPADVEFNIQKQLGPDKLLFRIGFMSKSAPLSRVILTLTPPPKCTINIDESALKNGAGCDGNVVKVPSIQPGVPFFLELSVTATDFPQGGSIGVQASFSGPAGPQSKATSQALSMPDIIRAVPSTTEQFGKEWLAHKGEFKIKLTFPGNVTPQALGKLLEEKSGVRIIQVIGKECIAGARVVGCGHWILAHIAVVDATNVNLTVRSNSQGFSEAVARVIHSGIPKQ